MQSVLADSETSPGFTATFSRLLDRDLLEQLCGVSHNLSIRPELAIFTAWNAVLCRYEAAEEIHVALYLRDASAQQQSLLLHMDVAGDPTFRVFLTRVQKAIDLAQNSLPAPLDSGGEALRTLFTAASSIVAFPTDVSSQGWDVAISLEVNACSLKVNLVSGVERIDSAALSRMVGHLETLLASALATPDLPLSALPLLTEAERHQLLVECNNTKTDYPNEMCVHQLFEQQVNKTPDAIAVVFEDQQLTYQQLNNRANQLAHRLQDNGVEPETLVALYLERSLEMVVGILAILKAGAAYVPLDTHYPTERLAFILQDCGAHLVVTQQCLTALLPQSLTLLCLDNEIPNAQLQTSNPRIAALTSQNLAYLIYTSGSTGQPKGVAVSHANVTRLMSATQDWFHFGPEDVWTLFHSVAFDFSVWELWGALAYGGRLIVVAFSVSRSPREFYELLCLHKVTVLNQTPSAFAQLMQAEEEVAGVAGSLGLRWVIFGGEALKVNTLRAWFARHGDQTPQLVNMYGITETTVHVTYRRLTAGDVDSLAQSPIGCALPDLRLYLLDRYQQPVPIGVAGEVYVGGAGVARGYWKRPELTAERFVADPFSATAGARLYKSGDMGRYLSNGDIEYLGRNDAQVKVRGFRVELGEIETALCQYPGVRQSVVVAQSEGGTGDTRLVAYLVSAGEQTPSSTAVREHLQQSLPEYMVPSAFVFLQALPLTPNGKLDRKALPVPDDRSALTSTPYVAPSTQEELSLALLWSQVLGIEQAGRDDNFFELGGHSLNATQLIARIRDTFGCELPLQALFEAPTVAQLAERLRTQEKGDTLQIPPRSQETTLPLSFAQERLWFLEQLEPDLPFYTIPFLLRLQGTLHLQALQASFHELVRRHEALRTTFVLQDDQPIQHIHSHMDVPIAFTDLTDLTDAQRKPEAQQGVSAAVRRPFDLTVGPLLRVSLWRLQSEEHLLLLTLNHLIADGWSISILQKELSVLYAHFTDGAPLSLPELPVQYGDYTLWQREWLSEQRLHLQSDYWQRQLADLTPLALPLDRARPAVQTYRGKTLRQHLSVGLVSALESLSQHQHVTLFMTLLAAFEVLLARYSGQDDIVVGSPIAGRTHTEWEALVGFFVNTLVLRADLSGNGSFLDLLKRVRRMVLEAYAHQDLPFARLVERLSPERDLSRQPVFQVMFILQNAHGDAWFLPGVEVHQEAAPVETSKFDLTLSVMALPEGLVCDWEYNTELFDEATLVRMQGHWQRLLEGIVAAPETPVFELPLLTEAERHQLLVECNDTKTDYPNEMCVHQLFEQQVNKTPDAIAVVCEDQQLTYRQLNNRANQLAHFLRDNAIGPDGLVGLCVARSPEMVVAILGILKAGAAYVPLDPEYPQERLAFMLEDCGAHIVVTQQALEQRLPHSLHRTVICLDAEGDRIAHYSELNPVCSVHAQNLAYVIYTSGSTGTPKGVAMPHRPLVNLLSWQNTTDLGQPARTLQFAALSFDVAFQEMFSTWCTGGILILLDEATRQDTAALLGFLDRYRIERLFLPFVALQHLAETAQHYGRLPRFLRAIITAGEQLKVTPHLAHLFTQLPECKLYNQYGPSETHVVTAFGLHGLVGTWPVLPPIGRPISNTQIYILDQHQQPVPIGVAGELYIGGDGVARGYLNRPELTAERFVVDPFRSEAGACLYRTGDLVRWLPDGNIDFLGRLDHQVKIRGFRIELGEIETALCQYPGVRQSVVVAQSEPTSSETFLVGYLVTEEGQEFAAAELRDHLKQSLPEYMVPSAFVFLQALPLTPNGKLDRKALPAFNPQQRQLHIDYIPPRNETEALLTQLFAQVLKVETVGVEDNFFELGGHSLKATQLIARIRTQFECELPLQALFEAPTVAQLAERLRTQEKGDTLQISPRTQQTTLPLSFAQERLWFLDQLNPNSAFYTIPVLLRLRGALDIPALQQALNAMVARHEALRTTFVLQEDQPVQCVHPQLSLSLVIHENTQQQQAQQEIAEVLGLPFNLEQGPLVRAHLWELEGQHEEHLLLEQEHLLLLTLHHIISDGWSMHILQSELLAHYETFTIAEPAAAAQLYAGAEPSATSTLPALPVQYADYALWQRQWLSEERLNRQTDYWQQKLANLPTLNLPLDKVRPPVQSYRGALLCQILPAGLVSELNRLSRTERVTLFMTLLAAFEVLLARYSGQDDIVVGTPIAGRTHTEWEALIGFFVNTLVLRVDLSGSPSFRELLGRVRSTTLEAYAHQDVPFEKLVEVLHPERDMSRNPLFQVMFILQNAQADLWQLSGLEVFEESVFAETAKFDLTLSVREQTEGLVCDWEYNTDLFDEATLVRMQGHWQTLLEGIVAAPETPVLALPLLTEGERHQLLVECNNTKTDYPNEMCVHQLFEQQVEKTPDAIAVVFEDQQLTYQQLNNRANQLAQWLQTCGVTTDTIVALWLERSLEALLAILAVLKAGAAYLPLSTDYPQQRLAFMLQDSQVQLLITCPALLPRAPQGHCRALCLPDIQTLTQETSLTTHYPPLTPTQRAYVMYTSGSTGQPKAVEVCHRNIVRLVCNTQYAHLGPDEVFLQLAPLAFDASTFEIWGCLLHGGRLVVCEIARPSLQELAERLQREQITTLWLTAGLFHAMVEAQLSALKQVRQLLAGGDVLSVEQVRKYLAIPGVGRLVNGYGPTETTTFACCYSVERLVEEASSVPIGRPIANTQVYVLDRHQQPVPIGVAGELYIGGDGVARGYLNRAELTAEKFVADPFTSEAGARLYRTGDLVRWLPDGNIEFLGRLDHQVKIRGFRIELGEIETALCQYPGVRQSVVVAQSEPTSSETFLVGYVVTEEGQEFASAELRDHLKQSLPEYMLPSAFVFLQALPLTPNGKLDRKALPAFNPQQRQLHIDYIPPRNETEARLTQLFAQVLKVETVRLDDNFFELGGHSLLAARLFVHIEQEFGKRLPLATLFQAPTIAALAPMLQQPEQTQPQSWSSLVAIQPKGDRPPFFCVHAVGANLLNYRLIAKYLGEDQPFYGFQSQGLDGIREPHTSVEEMAAHYITEMRTIQSEGPYRLGGGSAGGTIAFEMARQLVEAGESVALLVLFDTVACYDFGSRNWRQGLDWHLGSMLLEERPKPLGYLVGWLKEKVERFTAGRMRRNKPVESVLPEATRRVTEANRHALAAYRPERYSGRITQLLTRDMPYRTAQDPRLGWSELAEGGLEVHFVAGDHITMMEEPHVLVLAAILRQCLDECC